MFKFPEAPTFVPNYVKGLLDEIALEGLDGITPNDLWIRLNGRLYFPFKPIDEPSKLFLWNAVKKLKSVSFYELPEPRPPLVIYDRFEHIDPELGMIIEPEEIPGNIYPHCKVDDAANGIVGSCSTYYTRTDVTDSVRSMSLQEVDQKWGHKLVAVASQAARRRALQNSDVNPNLELTTMQYIVLERIGRSRYHGEITQGRESLQTVGEDAKSLFYLRKVLHKHRLITKQMFHQKHGTQNTCGLLLHLPRFFVERRPKALTLTENIVTYLKAKPKYMEEYNILRQKLNLGTALKKLSKTFNFQKFVKSDVVLYRVMYPDATESQWRYKGANKERSVRVLFLTDPSLDAKEVWQKYDDIYDDEDDDKCGLLDEGHRLLDRTMMAQAYSVLEKAGPEGVTQVELGTALGASKLAARMLVRNMTKSNKVTMFMKDEGRQRTSRFALKKFDKCSDMKKQMTEEKDKLLKLVKKSNKEKKETIVSQASPTIPMQTVENEKHLCDKEDGHITTKAPESMDNDLKTEVENCKDAFTSKTNNRKRKLDLDGTGPDSQVTVTIEDNSNASKSINTKGKKKKIEKILAQDSKDTSPQQIKKKISSPTRDLAKKAPVAPVTVDEVQDEEEEEIQMEITNPEVVRQELVPRRSLSVRPGDLENNSVSFRLLKRTNMIMEAVHKQKVIFDTSKLQKMIYEEETREGYDVRMDKKSLLRIINKLSIENHVKHMQVTLRGYGKAKTLSFVCHPSVSIDHSVIQSAVDQAKMKFSILGKEALKKKVKSKPTKPVVPQPQAIETLHENTTHRKPDENINLKYNGRMGRMYGFKPKYMRMQVLHKYMFYLIYGYDGDEDLDQTKALAEIESQAEISEAVKQEMSHIYTPSMDWKMFLPPLPVHSSYKEGWALMSDMLLRLPLSLFIQVVNVMYELPEIEEYLNHPIRKHFLVKNLPINLRTALTSARKYIFTIHEQVVRLCCTGLLQMGPQRLKEKDQVFIFLNRQALLWDTTSSPVGYHQIDKNYDYPIHHYYFHNMAEVEQYWYDLWNFCMHTMLGGRMCMSGKEVVLEGLQNKPEMVAALESRSVEEANAHDIGYLPGDHLGAAGFDSAMFAHLKRNWYWNTTKTFHGTRSSDSAPAPTTELQPIIHMPKREERKQVSKPVRMISETSSAKRRGKRDVKPEPKESQRAIKKKLIIKKTVRMLKHRKLSVRKPYYDQIDREALLKMSKLRVDWSAKEDNLLLLCKVAFVIFQYIGKRYHNLVTVRQLLHDQCPEATDKTSRACQRRLNYIMKNSQTQRSVNLCVEEMKQDQVVMKKLQDLAETLGTGGEGSNKMAQEEREERWAKGYCQLVLLLQERYKRLHSQELSNVADSFVLPDDIQTLIENYKILRPQKLKKRGFNSIKNVVDIQSAVINATILSSLNCVGDKTSWSYQLFNIYQQYPDKLLRAVMAKTRGDQMVSLRKRYLRTHVRSGDYLPLSSSPYQLSISYINLLLTRYQSELYEDCLQMYQKLAEACQVEREAVEVVAAKGGITACVVELATQEQLEFRLEIPDQIIVMDPNVIQKDETYTRIVQRYQDILSKCKEPDQVTMTAIFDEAYNSYSQDSTNDEETCKPAQGQNTIAKAATRIALYLTREECDRTMEQKEVQHAHDFFVVNASRVFCQLKGVKVEGEEKLQHLVPVPDDTVSDVLDRIRSMATLPDKGEEDEVVAERVSEQLQLSREFVLELIDFIKSKRELGATTQDLRERYGISGEVVAVVRALTDCQSCLRTGVNESRLVHWEGARPWVIRSYQLTRMGRERLVDPSRSTHCMLVNVGKNADQTTTMPDLEQSELKKEDTEPDSAKDSPSESAVVEDAEPIPSTSSGLRPPPPLIPLRQQGTVLKDECVSEVQQESPVKRSDAKFVSTSFRKVKKAVSFDPKAKCNMNVCVRPWIKISGLLNRRVLDKFLSSVLGHIMILPLCSLRMVQDRFLPAFQPHHTRELVEILAEIKCVEMLAVRQSHKPSLFSSPTEVSTVPAIGLESEDEILIEPDPLAVSRLACFIGETAYTKDVFSTIEGFEETDVDTSH